ALVHAARSGAPRRAERRLADSVPASAVRPEGRGRRGVAAVRGLDGAPAAGVDEGGRVEQLSRPRLRGDGGRGATPLRPGAAEREGRLRPGGVIVEATSGNTGVGLAIAAAVKGYRCIFTMPDKMSQEKARLLRALGAEVIITPTAVPPDHPDNYIVKGRAIAASHANAIFADQHYNQVNPEAHYRTTGPEIWAQTDGAVTHFVCSPGTGGTVSGAGRYLKERNSAIRVIAGDPVGSIYADYAKSHRKSEGHPYKVEGIGGDKIPSALHWDVIDEWMSVSDKDAMLAVRRLAREEGLLTGGSTGVNLVSALEVARRVNDPKALVVTILCDTGERYLSKVYNDEWLREN